MRDYGTSWEHFVSELTDDPFPCPKKLVMVNRHTIATRSQQNMAAWFVSRNGFRLKGFSLWLLPVSNIKTITTRYL